MSEYADQAARFMAKKAKEARGALRDVENELRQRPSLDLMEVMAGAAYALLSCAEIIRNGDEAMRGQGGDALAMVRSMEASAAAEGDRDSVELLGAMTWCLELTRQAMSRECDDEACTEIHASFIARE